jgi:hypothetical protein
MDIDKKGILSELLFLITLTIFIIVFDTITIVIWLSSFMGITTLILGPISLFLLFLSELQRSSLLRNRKSPKIISKIFSLVPSTLSSLIVTLSLSTSLIFAVLSFSSFL